MNLGAWIRNTCLLATLLLPVVALASDGPDPELREALRAAAS
jgi:hypothetical protein